MSESAGKTSALRVLAHPAFRTGGRNPYNALLYDHLKAAGVTVHEFSRRQLRAEDHDLWHLHWPEEYLNSPSVLRAAAYSAALLGLLRWARGRGTKVVWTIHNLQSHEGLHPRLERWFWRRFPRQVDGYISLSETGRELACGRFPALRQVPGFVIPHGHYREQYPAQLSRRTARDTLRLAGDARVAAFVGQIRRYKNVPALITQFRRIEDPRDVLLIAGSPLEAALREELSAAARGDARVRLDLRFLSNAELEVYISAADLVVLPYSEVLNSGSAILALSLNRPVLVPRLGAFEELRSSVGEDWIWTYEGALTASELEHALQWAVSSPRASAAPLDSMDWDPVTHATIEAYIKILTRNREPAPARQWAAAPETSV